MQMNLDGGYATGIMSLLLNSAILPVMIQSLYNSIYMENVGYENGNVMDLKPELELKVLTCVHDEEEMGPLISILNATGYSEESRVAVYVLQLKELKGSSTPFFIAHEGYHENKFIGSAYEEMMVAFSQLEQKSSGSVVVNAFTAISPPDTMYMDICTLACEQKTTLIILPFHRKWCNGGTVVLSEDVATRNMNRAVMDNAFCSIAILVHRSGGNQTLSQILSATSFKICMLFFGGNDDREALALVQRMAKDWKVCLTVIHFLERLDSRIEPVMDWDRILDSEQLKGIKNDEGVHYKEEFVKDGPETAQRIPNLVNGHDLVVVGRGFGLECPQTSGLSEWIEFPELGAIGDFLASTDVRCTASAVLIVQQQNHGSNVDCKVGHAQHGKPGKLKSMNINMRA